ncbi:MAG: hypothetical protein V4719_26560, partial [Planctomycetota bacterium]
MPGTPVTLTWWDNHVVGNQGYAICSGASNAIYNDTFLMTLNTGATYSKYCEFLAPSSLIIFRFYGLGPNTGCNNSGGSSSMIETRANEAAVLSDLANGRTILAGNPGVTGNMDLGGSFSAQWLGTEVDGGGGGEPHFVGFDGVQFDYQGTSGHWYTLMDCPSLRVSAEFTELDPLYEDTTFMTAMTIRLGEELPITLRLSDFPDVPQVFPPEATLNLSRGLVQGIQSIHGSPTASWTRCFPGGEICVTCLVNDEITEHKGDVLIIN